MSALQKHANIFVRWMSLHDEKRAVQGDVYTRKDMRECWDASNARTRTDMHHRFTELLAPGALQEDLKTIAEALTSWPSFNAGPKAMLDWQEARGRAIKILVERGIIKGVDDGDDR